MERKSIISKIKDQINEIDKKKKYFFFLKKLKLIIKNKNLTKFIYFALTILN